MTTLDGWRAFEFLIGLGIMKPNILIAVPAYGGSLETHTAASLVDIASSMSAAGWHFSLQFLDMIGVGDARNIFATRCVLGEFTHVLFIDADMSVAADSVLKLFEAKKPVIGLICPKRKLPIEFASPGPDVAPVKHSAPVEVPTIGMAVTLIERSVFLSLVDSGKVKKYTFPAQYGFGEVTFGFFDDRRSETTLLREDHAFCARWKQFCGGKIHALIDQRVGHVGKHVFSGRFSDTI